jgi:hypothetical protein
LTGEDIDKRIQGWLYSLPTIKGYHHPDSRRATIRGWPDWVFMSERGMIYREVKGTNDTVSPEQRAIGRLISNNGGDWSVWWPKDVKPGGRAQRELEQIA